MKEKDRKNFKTLLLDRLKEIQERNTGIVSLISEFDNKASDVLDRAVTESSHNYLLRIRDRERKLAEKIKSSLERIEKGSYGICDSCGEEISIKRLKARPVAEQCIECKTKTELLEKASGL